MWASIIPTIVKPITDLFAKRVERKVNQDSIKGKAAMAKLSGETQITLTDAEWEIAKANAESGSWKDEWITLVMTAPVALIIAGSLMDGTGWGNGGIVLGAVAGINALNSVGVPMGELMTATVFAGLGLKLWRGK